MVVAQKSYNHESVEEQSIPEKERAGPFRGSAGAAARPLCFFGFSGYGDPGLGSADHEH
jgi:hypothetical protein